MTLDKLLPPVVRIGELQVRPEEFAMMAAGDLLRQECSVQVGESQVRFRERGEMIFAVVGGQTMITPYSRRDTADRVLKAVSSYNGSAPDTATGYHSPQR